VQWEITGVPDTLRGEFSRRAGDIDTATDGSSRPTSPSTAAPHQRDHPETASASHPGNPARQTPTSLADLTESGATAPAARRRRHINWVCQLRDSRWIVRSDHLTVIDIQRVAEQTLAVVAAKRATFTRWNVYAETQRQLQAVASPPPRP